MPDDDELDIAIMQLQQLKRQIRYLRHRYAESHDSRKKNQLRDKRIELKELEAKIEEMMFPTKVPVPEKKQTQNKSIYIPTEEFPDPTLAAKEYIVDVMKHNKKHVLEKLKKDIHDGAKKSLNAFSRILDYNQNTMPQIKTLEIMPISKYEIDHAVKSPRKLKQFVISLLESTKKIYPDLDLVFTNDEMEFLKKSGQQQYVNVNSILREGLVRVMLQDVTQRVAKEWGEHPKVVKKFLEDVAKVNACLSKEARYYSPYRANPDKMESLKNTLSDAKEKAAEFLSRLKSRW